MGGTEQDKQSLPMPPAWLSVVVAIACVVAVFDVPYGYFQFLRLLVTGYSGYLAFLYFRSGRSAAMAWAFAFIALIFNPVFIIGMSKGVHSIFDLLAVVLIFGELAVLREKVDLTEPAHPAGEAAMSSPAPPAKERVEFAKFLARELAMVVAAIVLFGAALAAAVKFGAVPI